jgi:hypothetical protein
MTGPQHYVEAERLRERATAADLSPDEEQYLLAAAQVHATLALAAATALHGEIYHSSKPWLDVAS